MLEESRERNKETDFKGKAIKAKENAMKKVIAKNTGGSAGGSHGKGPNSGGDKKQANSLEKTL